MVAVQIAAVVPGFVVVPAADIVVVPADIVVVPAAGFVGVPAGMVKEAYVAVYVNDLPLLSRQPPFQTWLIVPSSLHTAASVSLTFRFWLAY